MNNKNFNNNDNESFMEGIYGCLERIETGIIELQKTKPSDANPIVRNEDNTALVQEIKTAVDSCNKEHFEETNAKHYSMIMRESSIKWMS